MLQTIRNCIFLMIKQEVYSYAILSLDSFLFMLRVNIRLKMQIYKYFIEYSQCVIPPNKKACNEFSLQAFAILLMLAYSTPCILNE